MKQTETTKRFNGRDHLAVRRDLATELWVIEQARATPNGYQYDKPLAVGYTTEAKAKAARRELMAGAAIAPEHLPKQLRIAVLGDSQTQANATAPAHAFFRGPLFVAALEYARRGAFDQIYIASTGALEVLHPDALVSPYKRKLNDLSLKSREQWGSKVLEKIVAWHGNKLRLTLLTAPVPTLAILGAAGSYPSVYVEHPLSGKSFGEQLKLLRGDQ